MTVSVSVEVVVRVVVIGGRVVIGPVSVVVCVTVVAPVPAAVEVTVVVEDTVDVETLEFVIVKVELPRIEGARTYMAPRPTTSPTIRAATTLTPETPLRAIDDGIR